jgi:hypothetical protein
MEDLQEIIKNIKYIHDNYLDGIAKSTIFTGGFKIFIEQCKKTFDSILNNTILEKNKKLIFDNYQKVNKLSPYESSSSKDILKIINLTAIILTCYNLPFYEFEDSTEKLRDSSGKVEDHVELKVVEEVNKNVQNFITHYVSIYEFIEESKNTPGYDEQITCLQLKQKYDGINCHNMLKYFLEKTKKILGFLFSHRQIGGNKWKHKYLKYKKKYLKIKKI